MGTGARACDGVWLRRLLHYGFCLSGVPTIQADKPLATSTRALGVTVDDCRHRVANDRALAVTAVFKSGDPGGGDSAYFSRYFQPDDHDDGSDRKEAGEL